MPTIYGGNSAQAINFGDGSGSITNNGPSTLYFSDRPFETVGDAAGSIVSGASRQLTEVYWFWLPTGTRTDYSLSILDPVVNTGGGTQGPPGPAGPPGIPGAPGPSGQDAVAISDAVRGQQSRFYREIGGQLIYNGSTIVARNDSVSRPQGLDLVVADTSKITITHSEIGPRALVDSTAVVSPNLDAAGIKALVKTADNLDSTTITLRQDFNLHDAFTNPADGTAWVKERGAGGPFTLVGLTSPTADFEGYAEGLSNVAASWRMEEASGATLDDAIGANDGTVVGTVTYGVTGGMPSNTSDKAITTPGTASNELTLPLAGITQAAFSVVMRAKIPVGASVPFRDATGLGSDGYCFGSDGGSPAHFFYRNGDNGASQFITSTLWSAVADSTWKTFVWTKSGATTAFYIYNADGSGGLVHTAATSGSVALAGPWHVGRNGTTTPYSQITVSSVKTYSRALTATEAANIHAAAAADGILHVTHANVSSTKASEIGLTSQGNLRPVLVRSSVTATGFDVKFLDDAGALVKAASAEMAFAATREVRDVPVNPNALSVPVVVEKTAEWADWVPTTSPILWARLSESGTSYNDEIGTNDGTSVATVTNGATSMVVGDADTGVTFDGTQGKIGFANPGLTGAFTIGLMFKITGAGSVGATDYGTLIGWGATKRILVTNSGGGLILAEMGGSSLASVAGTVAPNTTHRMFVTWDGSTQKIVMDGVVIASSVTANVSLNAAFYLGAFLSTSANYSFKGDMDELVLWDRALSLAEMQQGWANAANSSLQTEQSSDAAINFRGLFETFTPPPTNTDQQAAPSFTALPTNDVGGAVSGYISMKSYRDAGTLDFGPSSPWCHRALPTSQATRNAMVLNGLSGLPAATSANWVTDFCHTFGIDPSTGAVVSTQPGGAPLQGGSTPFYLRVFGEFIYIVPSTQPRRTLNDRGTLGGFATWDAQITAAMTALGGVPLPADAMPHFTADRYAFAFKPDEQEWWTLYSFITESPDITSGSTDDRAITTLELTGAPSSGGFFLEFDYQDNINQSRETFFLQTPVLYNDTAADIATKIFAAKTAGGAAFGTTRNFLPPVYASGGPLNIAPVTLKWVLAQALSPVSMRFTNNFMNAGAVHFDYTNSSAWTSSFLAAVTSPNVSTHHQPPISGTTGGTAAATAIDWMPMIIDWDEYNLAYQTGLASGWDAPGTDLGHVMAMSIGNCGEGHVFPAIRDDGGFTNTSGSRIMEGALMTLPTTADSSRVSPVFMPIFNTFKRYGIIPIDKTGGGCELIFRDPLWPGVTRPFPGPSTFVFSPEQYVAYMRQLPWHQMQIIDPVSVQAGW